jgi:hypothetical protein
MVINQFDGNYKGKLSGTRPGILHITFSFGVGVRFSICVVFVIASYGRKIKVLQVEFVRP